MTKGSYTINGNCNNNPSRPKDSSFKSFICTLLIFFAICLVILLASFNWRASDKTNRVAAQSNEKPTKVFNHPKSALATNYSSTQHFETAKKKAPPETTTLSTAAPGLTSTDGKVPRNSSATTVLLENTKKITTKTNELADTSTTTSSTYTSTSSDNLTNDSKTTSENDNSSFFSTDVDTTTQSEDISTTPGASSIQNSANTDDSTITSSTYISTSPDNLTDDSKTTSGNDNSSSSSTDVDTTTQSEDLSTTPGASSIQNSANTDDSTITLSTYISTSLDDLTNDSKTTLENDNSSSSSTDVDTTTQLEDLSTTPGANIIQNSANTDDSTITSSTYTSTSSDNLTDDSKTTSENDNSSFSSTDVDTTTQSSTSSTYTSTYTSTSSDNLTNDSKTTSENDNSSSSSTDVDTTTQSEDLSTTPGANTIQNSANTDDSTTTSSTYTSTSSDSGTEHTTTTPKNKSIIKTPMIAVSQRKTCDKPTCQSVASQVLGFMDHDAQPCDDFYEFACGNVYETEDVSVETFERHLSKIQQNGSHHEKYFKDFYSSCLDYETVLEYDEKIVVIESLVREVGWFELDSNEDLVNLTDLVIKLVLRQSMPLFDIGLDVDNETSNLIFQLTLPQHSGLRNSLKEWTGFSWNQNRCLNEEKNLFSSETINLNEIYQNHSCDKSYLRYLDFVQMTIQELLAKSNHSKQDSLETISKDIRFNLDFQILNISKALFSSEEILMEHASKSYVVKKVSDLQSVYRIFEWKTLFSSISGLQIADDTTVQVYFGKQFQELFQSLQKASPKTLYNAFLAVYANNLYMNSIGPKKEMKRSRFCLEQTRNLLPDIWASVAAKIKRPVARPRKRIITLLFEKLKDTFCENLRNASWIDDDSKTSINKKCKNFKIEFFESPKHEVLENTYNSSHLTGDYQQNLVALLIHYRRKLYSLLGQPLSADLLFSHFLDPLEEKPFESSSNSKIFASLAMISKDQKPLPTYMVAATVGFQLAQQMARHFDPTAMKYDINLSSKSKAIYEKFENKMSNFVNPTSYHNQTISCNINGSLSVTERIIDNTAFRLVLDTFGSIENLEMPFISSTYQQEKLIYIATAQNFCHRTTLSDFMLQIFEEKHLPPSLRVENIIGNSETFFSTFSCTKQSKMNRFEQKLQFPFL